MSRRWMAGLARRETWWNDGPTTVLVAAGCGLLAVAFFAPFVFRPGRMIFGTDMLGQAYQLRQFAVEEVRSGRGLPLWNPFVYGGLPFVGVLPGPIFYPTSALYLVLPLFRAISWTFVLHAAAAGVLGYVAARSFRLRRWPAALTGLSFMFAGYFLSTLYGGHDGRMFAMALIPGVFACLERGFRSGRPLPFLLLGLVVGLQIFTPHVQVMYFSSLLASLYFVYRWLLLWSDREGPEADGRRAPSVDAGGGAAAVPWRRAAYFVLAFVVAALLGSVQILPALDLMGQAVRGAAGQGGYEFASSWALPPQELTALFLPDLIGSLQGLYWGSNPFKLHTEYLGAVPLALAAVAVVAPRRDRRVWFLLGASVLGIAFALGDATPVHRVAYEVVPLVDRLRAPVMMLAPVSFFVALLAGFGCQRLLESRAAATAAGGRARSGGEADGGDGAAGGLPWSWIWVVAAPFLALALAAALDPDGLLRWARNAWFPPGWSRSPSPELAGHLRVTGAVVLLSGAATLALGQAVASRRLPRWALAGVALLLVLDLWRVDARYLETVRADRAFRAGPVVERLQAELGPGERVWPLEDTFGSNELMLHRIPTVTGSQNFRLSWFDGLVGGVGQQALLRHPVLWSLFDIRYLTARSRLQVPLLEEVTRERDTGLYRLRTDLPHAFFPDSLRTAAGPEEARRATRALRSPSAAAVVEPDAWSGPRDAADGSAVPEAGRGRASVETYHPDEVVLSVTAGRAGLLFVSEIYHPNWHAYVDGREVRQYRTDGAFRGVRVPAGEHTLRFVYRSGAFRAGALLSGATALALVVALGLLWRRRRSRTAGAASRSEGA